MLFLERHSLKALFQKIDASLKAETSIVVSGGSAVLMLCDGAKATKDVDLLPGENAPRFLEAFRALPVIDKAELDVNTASAAFESYLPEDWMERMVFAKFFSGKFLKVFTPCPEDLAIMKLFRFVAKDVEDIQRLFALPSFDPDLFKERFYSVLPVSIGAPRRHAQSFVILWNKRMPDNPLRVEQVLDACGLKS